MEMWLKRTINRRNTESTLFEVNLILWSLITAICGSAVALIGLIKILWALIQTNNRRLAEKRKIDGFAVGS